MPSAPQIVLLIWCAQNSERVSCLGGFSPSFFQLPSSVGIQNVGVQTINSIFLISNLRFCILQAHISSPNLELSNAALQALGFCTFNSNNTAELSGKQTNCDCKYIHQSSFFVFLSFCFQFDQDLSVM